MENKFKKPEAIIVVFTVEDIITTSVGLLYDPLPEGDEGEVE